jgi:NAD(P)-dependent dehydrogenase (short-subunit alcohol dehydrogenase family)
VTAPGGAAERFGALAGAEAEAVLTQVAPELMRSRPGASPIPREIADALAYLVCPRSANTAGSDLVVDGGLLKTA